MKTSLDDVEKARDAAVTEHSRLSTIDELLKRTVDELEEDGLKWQLTSKAREEYV